MSYTNHGEGNPNPNPRPDGYCQENFVKNVNECLEEHKACRWDCVRKNQHTYGNSNGQDACIDACNTNYSNCVQEAADELLHCATRDWSEWRLIP